jgi:hypothetical protein
MYVLFKYLFSFEYIILIPFEIVVDYFKYTFLFYIILFYFILFYFILPLQKINSKINNNKE